MVRDSSLEELAGSYVYSDYCSSEIRRLDVPGGGGDTLIEDRADFNVASFGEDACGRVHVAELGTGAVPRLTDSTSACSTALPLPPPPAAGAGAAAAAEPRPRRARRCSGCAPEAASGSCETGA